MKISPKLNKIAFKNGMNASFNTYVNEIKAEIKAHGVDPENVSILRKFETIEVKKTDLEEGSRTAIKYVSTRTVDKVGDVIVPKGIILKQFKQYGMPVYWNHNYSIPQIGRDEWVKSDDWGLKVKQKYADTGENTLSDILWKLTSQDMNKQSSVGIIPLEVIKKGDSNFEAAKKALGEEWPEFNATKKSCNRIIAKSILFEHSDVGMACNSDTSVEEVSKMFKDAGADEQTLKQLGFYINEDGEEEYDDNNDELEANTEVDVSDSKKLDITKDDKSDKDNIVSSLESNVKINEENKEITISGDTADIAKIAKVDDTNVFYEEVKEDRVVKLIREPRVTRLISPPELDYSEIKSVIREAIKSEIRKKMGRLI